MQKFGIIFLPALSTRTIIVAGISLIVLMHYGTIINNLEALHMDKILLSELIERTKNTVRSFEHSQSTSYQYQMA